MDNLDLLKWLQLKKRGDYRGQSTIIKQQEYSELVLKWDEVEIIQYGGGS